MYIYSVRNSGACIAICYSILSWLLLKIDFANFTQKLLLIFLAHIKLRKLYAFNIIL